MSAIPAYVALPHIKHRIDRLRTTRVLPLDAAVLGVLVDLVSVVEQLAPPAHTPRHAAADTGPLVGPVRHGSAFHRGRHRAPELRLTASDLAWNPPTLPVTS